MGNARRARSRLPQPSLDRDPEVPVPSRKGAAARRVVGRLASAARLGSSATPATASRPTADGGGSGGALTRRRLLLVSAAALLVRGDARVTRVLEPERQEDGPSPVRTARVERAVHQAGAPAPSTRYAVTVDGGPCVVYPTPTETGETNTAGSFTNFAFSGGPVTVVVTHSGRVRSAMVLPRSSGAVARTTGATVTFTITEPGPYELVVDGDVRNGLHVWANPLRPEPDPRTVTHHYGPGYYAGTLPDGQPLPEQTLTLTSGQSAYFDINAYFRGHLELGANAGADVAGFATRNVRVSGYGVVDSQPHASLVSAGSPCVIHNNRGSSIRGTKFLGVTYHGLQIPESTDVLLEDVGLINWRHVAGDTPDGVDGYGSSNVTLRRCFVRAHDDASSIKNHKRGFGAASPDGWVGSAESWLYEDCLFINGPGGNGSEIGYENFTRKSDGTAFVHRPPLFLRDITYRRHTVVKFRDAISYRMSALGIHLADRLDLSNVLYEDVEAYVYGGEHAIFVGSFFTSDYDTFPDQQTEAARARISGVTFRRVTVQMRDAGNTEDATYPVTFQGGGPNKPITGVTMEDVSLNGEQVTGATQTAGPDTWVQSDTVGPTFV